MINLNSINYFALIILVFIEITIAGHSSDKSENEKLGVCVVEGRGAYKKASKFCPVIESNSNIECVIGVDRLDCVRRIHKGTAHFGVFSSEDLVAARWATVEILVTNEMRFHNTPFEYEIVAIVDNEAEIHTAHDIRGARFCHPGHGLENHYTEVLANYFESLLVPKSCDPNLSLNEDRIQASAKFFGPTCKAGPWVPDPTQDRLLKNRYPTLCQLCYDSYRCGVGDKHWGRRGALYCLTSGSGQVAWARLDDVKSHFGLSGMPPEANQQEYSFLCPDGHLQPLNTTQPCIWVAKPWPAIAARRSHASQIQDIVSKLSHDEGEVWERALLSLLESYHVRINTLDNTIPIDDYLDQATGFQSAYSFPECNPPRSIVFCTTSIIQHVKCSWLQEASQVHGIEPNLQCIRAPTQDICFDDARYGAADVVLVDQDVRIKAQRDFGLIPLLYEFSHEMHERYVTIAVVRKSSKFKSFYELEGYNACLPSYEGAAHLSVLETIYNITGQKTSAQKYFSRNSCIWDGSHSKCPEVYRGDEGALRCLADEAGDVAFLSSHMYKNFTDGSLNSTWTKHIDRNKFEILCPYGSNSKHSKFEYCHMHWTARGHLMIQNSSLIRQNEIYNSLRDMDRLFGKQYKEYTKSFTMYGPFDRRHDIMFRDNTDSLRGLSELRRDKEARLMENIYFDYSNGKYPSNGIILECNKILVLLMFGILMRFIF